MSQETLNLIISIGGLAIAAVGLPFLFFQIRNLQRWLRSTTHAAMYDQAAGFRAHLVQHPNLRKYFFEGVEIDSKHPEYDRVLTIAEIYLNYLEHISVLGNDFGSENRPALERFTKAALDKSPILRKHLSKNKAMYSDALNRLVR